MGEIMVEFNAMTRGPLRDVQLFEKHAAGAEGNVAIGISRLGCSSGVISRVGNDEFGYFLLGALKAEGVDTSHVTVDSGSPTASFFIQRGHPIPDKSEAFYYRKGSAASKLSLSDVDTAYIASSKLFHITGITPALSESARDATIEATKAAKRAHVMLSVDTNIRLKLWSEEEARSNLLPLCQSADIVFTSCPDSKIILDQDQPEEIAKLLHKEGVKTVVVKLGAKGAFASSAGEVVTQSAVQSYVEDPTGCGDSFAAAFLATQMKGWKLKDSMRAATATAALVISVRGDYENIPSMEALQTLLGYESGKTEYLR
jgi:2-dehydro-3-deoxygluconokinase / 2-dehydro-3-deoxygalactonokinase